MEIEFTVLMSLSQGFLWEETWAWARAWPQGLSCGQAVCIDKTSLSAASSLGKYNPSGSKKPLSFCGKFSEMGGKKAMYFH